MLTGMRQQVGNFPGVTVDKKFGQFTYNKHAHTLVDFPGTYSVYPRSRDEEVVYDVLANTSHNDYPDLAIVVCDKSNLTRNLLLFTQVYDLGIPTILVLNMSDIAERKGIVLDLEQLKEEFPKACIVETTARLKLGKERLLKAIEHFRSNPLPIQPETVHPLLEKNALLEQEQEAERRYHRIEHLVAKIEKREPEVKKSMTNRLDKILVHPIWGYLIFALILLIVFQFIFSFANYPMDFIEGVFNSFSTWTSQTLPAGVFTDLIAQGIIPGIGGVFVFIPQIALLFFFIAILEESGYLARVVFIMDRLMRPLGLNGKSVVPMLSSVACAIPGIMATRTIADWKERLITILIAPLMSCSARIPVYTLLIGLVIPKIKYFGFIELQGLVLFGLYALGLVSALLVAVILKFIIRSESKGFLLLELPGYKSPKWGNVALTVTEKVRVFVFDAGKVILAISVILWVLASYGPGEEMSNAEKNARYYAKKENLTADDTERHVAAQKLRHSYMGYIGHGIEPVIKPLGFDWKIGISLISSFAAREVFVVSLATIYAVHDDGGTNQPLIERLRQEKKPNGTKVYTLASGVSLMIFYVFAMQCMATLAVVKRETKSWQWPLIQIGFMGVLAYLGALLSFNILN